MASKQPPGRTHLIVGGEHVGKACRILSWEERPSDPGRGKSWVKIYRGAAVMVATAQLRRRY